MSVEIVGRARGFPDQPAIDEGPQGRRASYGELVAQAEVLAHRLLGTTDLGEARVAYLVPSGVDSVATLWGIWLAGGIAVPLALSHPEPELEYVIGDAAVDIIVTTAELRGRLTGIAARHGARLLLVNDMDSAGDPGAHLPEPEAARRALIVYTSGSTGKPKGAVWTHEALRHQVMTLVDAWRWSPQDRALLLLPLHHVHGLINVVTCGLWSGATIRVQRNFDARAVWDMLGPESISVLMAVPTIYHKLIEAFDGGTPAWQERVASAAARLRLMVSGSAALPVTVLQRWRAITGHVLLERYGMTEIGMALSNPYDGPRVAGSVGWPLPGVEVRVVDDAFRDVTEASDGDGDGAGQLLVRSPGIFAEYWRRPDATRAAFHDGWFMTGDAVEHTDDGYRIRGRMNTDIIKTGGYKVSALEIEEVLRTHPAIDDCAIVALDDAEWGQTIAAAIVCADRAEVGGAEVVGEVAAGEAAIGAGELDGWLRSQLAPYKVPRRIAIVEELPRNALGKVVKPRVREELFGQRQATG